MLICDWHVVVSTPLLAHEKHTHTHFVPTHSILLCLHEGVQGRKGEREGERGRGSGGEGERERRRVREKVRVRKRE